MKSCKIICLLLVLMLAVLCFAGCKEKDAAPTSSSGQTETTSAPTGNSAEMIKSDKEYGFQYDMPEKGEEVAVLHTNYGDIYIRLFPDEAPKAVENFKGLIQKKYYDGLIFHRVIKDFMIQGGDPLGTGTGGESIWGKPFEDQFCDKLMNVSYSLSMANSGSNTNGSQFFINNAPASAFSRDNYSLKAYEDAYKQYTAQYGAEQFPTLDSYIDAVLEQNGGQMPDPRLIPEEVLKLYEKHGGNIHLDGAWRQTGGHTVFGQVFKGQDVVDKIIAVETGANDKPVKDVVINSAEIIKYQG